MDESQTVNPQGVVENNVVEHGVNNPELQAAHAADEARKRANNPDIAGMNLGQVEAEIEQLRLKVEQLRTEVHAQKQKAGIPLDEHMTGFYRSQQGPEYEASQAAARLGLLEQRKAELEKV